MSVPRPSLGYRDAQAALRFLIEAFGFEEDVVYRAANTTTIGHAVLRWPGGGEVSLHSAERNSIADLAALAAEDGGYPGVAVHIDVDDPDALYARAVAAGAAVVRELKDSPFGTRDFVVSDTEGLYWSFGTRLPRLVRDQNGNWRPEKAGGGFPPLPTAGAEEAEG